MIVMVTGSEVGNETALIIDDSLQLGQCNRRQSIESESESEISSLHQSITKQEVQT